MLRSTAQPTKEIQRSSWRKKEGNDGELMTRNLERESKRLRDVQIALERIEEGSYGTCLNCEEEISTKRLNAVPWTSLCIDCQELDDRRRGQGADNLEWLLKAA